MKKIALFLLISINIYSQNENYIVLKTAESQIGKKVGTGRCFDLVDYSLSKVDRQWLKRSENKIIYGDKIRQSNIKPGDIILYEECKLKDGRYINSHVAIIYEVIDSNTVKLLEQNTKRSLKESIVVVSDEDISSGNIVKGKVKFYRPY